MEVDSGGQTGNVLPGGLPVLQAKVVQARSKQNANPPDTVLARGVEEAGAEVVIKSNRAEWRSAGLLQQTYPVTGKVFQVALCRFEEGEQQQLCILQSRLLLICSIDGETNTVSLPADYTELYPLALGLIVAGAEEAAPRVLPHSTEDLQPMPVELKSIVGTAHTEMSSGWLGEQVLWVGAEEAPFAMTYNRKVQRLRVWQINEASPGAHAAPPEATWRTPQQAKLQRRVVQSSPASGSGVKRPSIRMANGHLSPAAFSPVPQTFTGAILPPVTLLPAPPLPFTMALITEQHLTEDSCPCSALLFHDLDGSSLLAMMSRKWGCLTAIRLPRISAAPAPSTLEVVMECDAVAATAIKRSDQAMNGDSSSASQPLLRDLLVLGQSGELRLHVGGSLKFRVVIPPSVSNIYDSLTSKAVQMEAKGRQTPTLQSPAMAATPKSAYSMASSDAGSGMDVVMGSPASGLLQTPSPVKQGAVAGLTMAGHGQAYLVYEGGQQQVISIPFLASTHLVCISFAALHHTLSKAALGELMEHFCILPGSSSESSQLQWASFADAIVSWASSADPILDPGCSSPPATDQASAWALLQVSALNRSRTRLGHFACLWQGEATPQRPVLGPGTSTAVHPEAQQALQALHALYEDAKLHTARWRWLQSLGQMLARLAGLLGTREYLDFYHRDLGPLSLPAVTSIQQTPGYGPPASVQNALYAVLAGQPSEPWLSSLLAQKPAYLQRSMDVLHFYSILARAAEDSADRAPRESLREEKLLQGSQRLVLAMVERGWDQLMLNSLPFGVALPLRNFILRCRKAPPSGWPVQAYQLISRADIVANLLIAETSEALRPVTDPTMDGEQSLSATRPALPARTPLRQPQLRTPAKAGGHQRSRMSIGSDPVIAAAAAAAVATPPQLPVRGLPKPPTQTRHCMPYAHRLRLTGVDWDPEILTDGDTLRGQPDGMEGLVDVQKKQRFGPNLRLMEVRKLLQSSSPAPMHIKDAAPAGDSELASLQQKRLMALAVRTMALPCGRAALTLGTLKPLPTEPLDIPQLNLAGLLPEQQNAVVKLDLTGTTPAPGGGASADFTAWPEFHNGVAAGLRLAPGGAQLTRTWIVYNKPKEPSYTHAGMLMGLGLTGHLNCLAATDLYRYLSQEHDATTAGVLLGMAAAKRGTSDATISKMLFLHVPTRHPAVYPELELSPLVQSAALLGVGLLYQGTCHRLTAEIMLEEIGRKPGSPSAKSTAAVATISSSGTTVSADREGYALSAGLALGLICLGHGRKAVGLADMHIEDRLRYFMVGGKDPRQASRSGKHLETIATVQQAGRGVGTIGFDPTLGGEMPWGQPGISPRDHRNSMNVPTAPQGHSQLVIEGDIANLDVTAPGATLALGLMYLQTNDKSVAEVFAIPATHFALDYVRPDFIMLRVLARALVMWDSMQPTDAWLISQMPPLIRGPMFDLIAKESQPIGGIGQGPDMTSEEDPEAVAQAHINAVTGACLAMGIRYAGTAHPQAREVLTKYVLHFLHAKLQAPDPYVGAAAVWGRLDKQVLENCLNVVSVALAVVMAGSGDLDTCRLLRGLRRRLSQGTQNTAGAVFFGNHMSISMALGFLFYGGGTRTFSTSKAAVAALVVSLFPRYPLSPTDNRCHLQVFRHLHVLASTQRCVEAIDVDTREPLHLPVSVTQKGSSASSPAPLSLTTPCLLPDLSTVEEVAVGGAKHYAITLKQADTGFSALLQQGKFFVQQDPEARGFQAASSATWSTLGTPAPLVEVLAAVGSKTASTSAILEHCGMLETCLSLNCLHKTLQQSKGGTSALGLALPVALWNLRLANAWNMTGNWQQEKSLGRSSLYMPARYIQAMLNEVETLLRSAGGSEKRTLQLLNAYLQTWQLPGSAEVCKTFGAYLALNSVPAPGSISIAQPAAGASPADTWIKIASQMPRGSPESARVMAECLE